jgi:hypothetical protein
MKRRGNDIVKIFSGKAATVAVRFPFSISLNDTGLPSIPMVKIFFCSFLAAMEAPIHTHNYTYIGMFVKRFCCNLNAFITHQSPTF